MTDRRQKPRPVSTIRAIMDITFTVIRKTEQMHGPFERLQQEKKNVQTDAGNSN
jgi:hypothetical protein